MTTRLPIPQTEEEVKALANKIAEEFSLKLSKNPAKSYTYFIVRLKSFIAKITSEIVDENISDEDITLSSVPAKLKGDYALQIPKLKKEMEKYRSIILPKLSEALKKEKFILEAETTGPFLNITLNPNFIVSETIRDIQTLGKYFGEGGYFSEQKVIVEYSSPNMGKSLHVGHLGTTLLGQGLANIFTAAGATVYRVSHVGDWGTPCGMLEVGYSMYKDTPEISTLSDSPSKFYSAIYAKFNEAAKEDLSLRDKAKAAFAALERGEENSKRFWQKVRSESSTEFDRLYEQLGVNFDIYLGEAFYEPYLNNTIKDLTDSKIAHADDGAIVVDLEDVNLKSVLLRKSDGATTYFARDVVALYKRKDLFDYDLTLYIVGSEQTLHFRQLFELANRMLKNNAPKCVHVPIGLITQKGSKISSRAGGALGAEELKMAIYERAKAQIDESLAEETSEKEREDIASILTRGALYYNQLLTAPGKPTDFNLDKVLDMKGKSGAYLQYAAVRGKSILKKVGVAEIQLDKIPEEIYLRLDESAISLVRLLAEFPEIVKSCCLQYSPHPLAHYLYDLGQMVNHFYQKVRIKDLDSPLKDLYLHILEGSVVALTNGLRMLNIEVPERM